MYACAHFICKMLNFLPPGSNCIKKGQINLFLLKNNNLNEFERTTERIYGSKENSTLRQANKLNITFKLHWPITKTPATCSFIHFRFLFFHPVDLTSLLCLYIPFSVSVCFSLSLSLSLYLFLVNDFL